MYDAAHLPAQYMTWHDSLNGEKVHFTAPVEQYLQNKLDVIREFIEPEQGAKLMTDIYWRIVKGERVPPPSTPRSST